MYHEQFVTLAAYNTWANQRLYRSAASVSADDFHADRGVFFRSLAGTLNHILCADRIWLQRFTGAGDAPNRLDAILQDALEPLTAARAREDARLEAYVAGLSDQDLAAVIRYSPISQPGTIEGRLGPTLLHVFNHQTHHRGQAHAVLTGLGLEGPSLDLVLFQRETGRG